MSALSHRRPLVVLLAVLGALLLVVVTLSLVPRGGHEPDALRPSSDAPSAGAGVGATPLTPAMRAEIDRVVGAGSAAARTLARTSGRATPQELAAAAVRCADFDGQRYCLGTGWTEKTQEQVRAEAARAARVAARHPATEQTGDLDVRSVTARAARVGTPAEAEAERAELTAAARSVAKVWMLRHDLEGVALPAGFAARHPAARAAGTSTASSRRKGYDAYPRRTAILDPQHVRDQHQTYWCGPTTMQMIAWGWRGKVQPQQHWAQRLGTTTSGTAISSMVHVVNRSTGYDRAGRAGPYIVLDISDYDYRTWMTLMMRHLHDYRAPVVLHPILHKAYYPYLDDDASGHFQVGRGYDKRGGRPDLLGYFEPWNQQRFDPSEPFIDRVQWRLAYKSYRANEAHFQHNVGV